MHRRRTARVLCVLRTLLGALCAWLLCSCGGGRSEFDRLTPPIRFADLRESAAWVEGFDPAWWREIDRAYAAYDASIDDELIARWDAFAADVSEERVRGQAPDSGRARRHLALRREIDRTLGEREGAFIAALVGSLPPESAGFTTLVAARASFQRASGMLREPAQRLPGPLEVLQLCGRRPLDPVQLELAAAAYTRLTAIATDVTVVRAQRFVSLCSALEPVDRALGDAEYAERNGADDTARAAGKAARESAQSVRDRLVKDHDIDAARRIERFRLALLREDRAFAQAFAPTAEFVSDYLEQVDFVLHDGIRVAPGIRAFASIARLALERLGPDDPDRLEEFDGIVAKELERQAELMPLLASESIRVRRDAYEKLKTIGDPIGAFLERELKKHGGMWRVLERTVDVMAGVQSPEDAATAVMSASGGPEAQQEQFVAPGRDRNVQILFGCPLEPEALRSLGLRLGLDERRAREAREFYDLEVLGLERAGKGIAEDTRRDFELLGARDGTSSEGIVNRFMSRLAGHIARVRSLDAVANDRVISRVAELAGTTVDDERFRFVRLELAMLQEVGVSRAADQAEPFCGVNDAAIVNPLEIVRQVARTAGERATGEEVVVAHADELLAAHRVLRESIRRNLRGFLVAALELSSARAAARGWRPALAGAAAAELRLRIADELRVALGDEFGDRYDAAVRRIVAPGCEPRPSAALAALRGLTIGGDGEAGDRAVARELLREGAERRRTALRDLLAWRAHWVRIGDFASPESWNELERVAPSGWILRARAADADERAVAACESVLVDGGRLPGPAIVMPRRFTPNFD